MKFAYAMLVAAVAAQDEEVAADDSCACVGAEALPADLFTDYAEGYGADCGVWDADETYCAADGEFAEELYCAAGYEWCYVDVLCATAEPTTFFADTEYADTLAWSDAACAAAEEEAATKMYAAVSAAIAVAALAM
jgi:hypothetical protein